MSDDDLVLFDVDLGSTPPLPRSAKAAKKQVVYVPYSIRSQRCTDCEHYVYEQLKGGTVPGLQIRLAKYKRIEGGHLEYLCHDHKIAREELDGTAGR